MEIIHSSFRSFAMRWCRLSSRCFPSAIMVNDRLAAVAVFQLLPVSRLLSARSGLWSKGEICMGWMVPKREDDFVSTAGGCKAPAPSKRREGDGC